MGVSQQYLFYLFCLVWLAWNPEYFGISTSKVPDNITAALRLYFPSILVQVRVIITNMIAVRMVMDILIFSNRSRTDLIKYYALRAFFLIYMITDGWVENSVEFYVIMVLIIYTKCLFFTHLCVHRFNVLYAISKAIPLVAIYTVTGFFPFFSAVMQSILMKMMILYYPRGNREWVVNANSKMFTLFYASLLPVPFPMFIIVGLLECIDFGS